MKKENLLLGLAVLSFPLLIPQEKPVRLKLPNASEYTEITSFHPLLPGSEIDPENTSAFRVLYPDLRIEERLFNF